MWFCICVSSSVSLIYVFVLVLLHAVFITMALQYSLKPCMVILQHCSFYSALVWVVRNFSASVWILRFCFCIYVRNDHWNFDGDCLKECRLLLVLAIFSLISNSWTGDFLSFCCVLFSFFLYIFKVFTVSPLVPSLCLFLGILSYWSNYEWDCFHDIFISMLAIDM